MNKSELIEYVSNETGFTKSDSETALNAVLSGIMKGVKNKPPL